MKKTNDAFSADFAMLGNSGYDRVERDWYSTPREATIPIVEYINKNKKSPVVIWEPAAGDGAMSDVLKDVGDVSSSDVQPLAHGIFQHDFYGDFPFASPVDWIVTNPPYGKEAEKFIVKSLQLLEQGKVTTGCAFLLRNEYDCASTRDYLFNSRKFKQHKIILTWRVRWIPGSTVAPRHNYAWYVWERPSSDTVRVGMPTISFAGQDKKPLIRKGN